MNNPTSANIDRREFLKMAGVTAVAGTIVACSCNLQRLITTTPEKSVNAQSLQDLYGMTEIKARTFSVFIDNRAHHLGRRAIARKLGISINTLKDHITQILKDVQSTSSLDIMGINDAVNAAVDRIGLNPQYHLTG